MLYRKITSYIEDYLKSDNDKILILEGARQIGKSFSIREVGTRLYPNYVEINFVEDDEGMTRVSSSSRTSTRKRTST